jgi:integrase/recombinase XerD
VKPPAQSFPSLVQAFFTYLRREQAVSEHTVAAYRDTFRLLLRFFGEHRRIPVDQIALEDFCPDTILAFLEHLEKNRRNLPRTRNARLTAIRAFVRFALTRMAPEFVGDAHRILAIPSKRANKPVLGFLQRKEVDAILAAVDVAAPIGQRDHLLFSLLYNTGARISEALQLTPADVLHRVVHLHGKGRKQRDVPLWPQTHQQLQRWCRDRQLATTQPIFANAAGRPLSRRSAARRLALALQRAQLSCPSLHGRKISLHTFRHTTAMHLLQSGVSIEIIALWLGHEQLVTTHGYIEADLSLKKAALDCLQSPRRRRVPKRSSSQILEFLHAL